MHTGRALTRGTRAFSRSEIVETLFNAWEPRSTSCPPSKVGMMDTGLISAGRFPFELMFTLMNEKSSNPEMWPPVTHFIWIPSSTGFCRKIGVFFDTTTT